VTTLRRHRVIAVRRWAVAVAVYLVAVFHRTSLGVAGLQAADRFGISPSQLSIFVLLQLGVYAGMQIPTGILVDRYGPRRLLLVAAMTMGIAQCVFAVAHSYPVALFARALLGCGDALTFVSVLRFAAAQFSPKRYPLIVAITGMLGSVGNVASTLPLSALLRDAGWTPTFLGAGVLSFSSGAAVYFALPKSGPVEPGPREAARLLDALSRVRHRVRSAWSMAGTRAGFWVHFTSMSTMLMFGLLWGVPFLVQAEGFTRDGASTALLGSVLVTVVASPIVGLLTARYRATRVPLAIGTSLVTVLGWAAALALFSGPMPRGLLTALVLITGIGGPASSIGFALARDYNGPAIVGTATGVVNVGGFVAGILASLGMGWTLSALSSVDRHAYRVAFGVALLVQVAGLVQTTRWWLRARHAVLILQDLGKPVPVPVVRHRWDLSR
jgi:MFS family permease